MKTILKFTISFFLILLLISCSESKPTREGKFKVVLIGDNKLTCSESNNVFEDVTYTTADKNIKVGDSISLMYIPSTKEYYIKENFPKNLKAKLEVEKANQKKIEILKLIINCLLLLSIVLIIIFEVMEFHDRNK